MSEQGTNADRGECYDSPTTDRGGDAPTSPARAPAHPSSGSPLERGGRRPGCVADAALRANLAEGLFSAFPKSDLRRPTSAPAAGIWPLASAPSSPLQASRVSARSLPPTASQGVSPARGQRPPPLTARPSSALRPSRSPLERSGLGPGCVADSDFRRPISDHKHAASGLRDLASGPTSAFSSAIPPAARLHPPARSRRRTVAPLSSRRCVSRPHPQPTPTAPRARHARPNPHRPPPN